jgi:hypothetical protein
MGGSPPAKQPPAVHEAETRRYAQEQDLIKKAAVEAERQRDEKSREADPAWILGLSVLAE